MDVLERLLFDLCSCLDEESLLESKVIVQNIELVVIGESSSSQFDNEYALNLLFQSETPPSLLKFLNCGVRHKDRRIIQGKIEAYKFIGKYITYLGLQVESLSLSIFNNCYDLFRHEESKEVKQHCLLPMKKLLSLALVRNVTNMQSCMMQTATTLDYVENFLTPANINLNALYQNLLSNLHTSKQSKGGRSEILKVLGLLVRIYPDHESTVSNITTILNDCDQFLKSNFAGSVEPDFPCIAGCFSCLDRCMHDFEERYVNSKELWVFLLKGVSSVLQEDVHRYAVVNKALRLIKNHASMFRNLVGLNIAESYKLLNSCCNTQKSSILKHAEGALLNVLTQASLYVVGELKSIGGSGVDGQGIITTPLRKTIDTMECLIKTFFRELDLEQDCVGNDNEEVGLQEGGGSIARVLKCIASVAPSLAAVAELQNAVGGSSAKQDLLATLVRVSDQNLNVLHKSLATQNMENSSVGVSVYNGRKLMFFLAMCSVVHAADVSISEEVLLYFLKTVPELIVHYPYLPDKYQTLAQHSFCVLIQGACRRETTCLFADIMEILIPCLFTRSISIVDVYDVDGLPVNMLTGTADGRLFSSYLPLWISLLHPFVAASKLSILYAIPAYSIPASRVFDSLCAQILHSLRSLDFSYTCGSMSGGGAGVSTDGIVATNPADQELLLNMVCLLDILLPNVVPSADSADAIDVALRDRFQYWIDEILLACVPLSVSFPMVSCFYRLIHIIIAHGEAVLGYISKPVSDDSVYSKRKSGHAKLKYYFGIVVGKLSLFRDELLSQALKMLFHASTCSMLPLVEVISSVSIALVSGAETVTAVGVLSSAVGNPELIEYLPAILPLLDKYLVAGSVQTIEGDTSLKLVKNHRSISGRGYNSGVSFVTMGTAVDNLQFCILRFLGRVGGLNKLILPTAHETLQVSLDSIPREDGGAIALKVPLPADTSSSSNTPHIQTVSLAISNLLPRVVEVATHSNEQQMKITAGEVLHGLILYVVGLAATDPGGRTAPNSPYTCYYRKLFPAALSLSISDEVVVRELFSTLFLQLVRWFSGHNQVHADDSQCMIECILDGLCEPVDNSIREFCSDSLVEYVKWSIKQATAAQLRCTSSSNDSSVSAIHSLISRLLVYCVHPTVSKRHGAAMVLRKVYKFIGGEAPLASRYCLLIIYTLLKSLRLCARSVDVNPEGKGISQTSVDASNSTRIELIEALDRYEHIIVTSVIDRDDCYQFASNSKESKDLTEFPHCLEDVVDWVWKNGVAFPEAYFRRSCMKSFASLCPLLSLNDPTAAHKFVISRLDGPGGVGGTWGDLLAMTNLAASSPASLINSEFQCEEAWLASLDAFVDVCNWLMRKQYVDVHWICALSGSPAVPVVNVSDAESSRPTGNKKRKAGTLLEANRTKGSGVLGDSLLEEMLRFVEYCCACVRISPVSSFPVKFDAADIAKMQVLRSEVMSRVLQLLCSIFEIDKPLGKECVLFVEKLWTGNFSTLISNLLLHPSIAQIHTGTARNVSAPFFQNSLEGQQSSVLIPEHVHRLLKLSATEMCGDTLLPDCISNSLYSGLAELFLNSLDEVIALQVQEEDISCCEEMFLRIKGETVVWNHFSKALCAEIVNRGGIADASVETQLIEYAYQIFQSVVQYSENCSASDVEIGNVAIHLSFIMGLPFVPPSFATPAEISEKWLMDKRCVLQVLLDNGNSKCVDLFLDRYSGILVEGLTAKTVSENGCSFAFTACAPVIFSLYFHYRGQHALELVQGYLVLSRIVSRVLAHILTSLTSSDAADRGLSALVEGVLRSCSGSIFDLAHEHVVQVLELDACIDSLKLRNSQLYTSVSSKCISVLSDASASTDDIMTHLRYLPYILPGVLSTCRLRYSQIVDQGGTLCQASCSSKNLFNCYDNQPIVQITEALEEMVANVFPLNPNDIDPSCSAGKRFSMVFRVYLDLVGTCGAPCLLTPLTPSIRLGSSHRYYSWIRASIVSVVSLLDTSQQSQSNSNFGKFPCLTLFYRFSIDNVLNEYYPMEVKQFYFEEVCIPLLQHCNDEGLVDIFSAKSSSGTDAGVAIVKQLVNTIQKPIVNTLSPLELRSSLYLNTCSFALLTTLYDCCSLSFIKNDITKVFHGPEATGKELTVAICRAAHRVVRAAEFPSENSVSAFSGTPVSGSNCTLNQLLWSNAYCCLCIVVAKTQLSEAFFENFLFKEKETDLFWFHVIDIKTDMFCNSLESNSSKFGSVEIKRLGPADRNNVSSTLGQSGGGGTAWLRSGSLQSQYLHGSMLSSCSFSQTDTLSRDSLSLSRRKRNKSNLGVASLASQLLTNDVYDVHTQSTQSGSDYRQEYDVNPESDTLYGTSVVAGLDDFVIEMECNSINKSQRCMGVLMRTIQRMDVLFGKTEWTEDTVPNWLKICKEKMLDDSGISGHANVRLFFLRLIINEPISSIVSRWASDLIGPTLKVCMDDVCGGEKGNPHSSRASRSLLKDMAFVLTHQWASVRLKDESIVRSAGCRFLSHMIREIYDSDSAILKDNVKKVGDLIRLWIGNGSNLISDLDLYPIVELLSEASAPSGGAHAKATSRGSESVKKRLAGLEIVIILLKCGYPLLNARVKGSNTEAILECVLNSIAYPRKEVSEYASVVAGEILSAVQKNRDEFQIRGKRSYHEASPAILVPQCNTFQQDIETTLAEMNRRKDGLDAISVCIRAICRGYSTFMSREIFLTMVAGIRRMKPKSKMNFLEALYVSNVNFEGISIMQYLRTFMLIFMADISTVVVASSGKRERLPLVQLFTIKLLGKHAADLSTDYIKLVLGKTSAEGLNLLCDENSHVKVREAAYNLLMKFCDEQASLNSNVETNELLKRLRIMLLKGLSDPDSRGMSDSEDVAEDQRKRGIRRMVFDYFNARYGLSELPINRLNTIMEELFDESMSDQWLHYAPYLVLMLAQKLNEYRNPLFTHDLSNSIVFKPMELQRGNIGSSDPSVPLFAMENTQSQLFVRDMYSSQSNSGGGILSSRAFGGARATQERGWTQSVESALREYAAEEAGSGTRSHSSPLVNRLLMTQHSIISKRETTTGNSDIASIPTSQGTTGSATSVMPPPVGFPVYYDKLIKSIRPQYTVVKHRARFNTALEEGDGDSALNQEGELSQDRFAGSKTVRFSEDTFNREKYIYGKKVDKRVGPKSVVYRKYREGELPDIRIALKDILYPLQCLMLRDATIAKTIFIEFFSQLYDNNVENERGGKHSNYNAPQALSLRNNLIGLLNQMSSQGQSHVNDSFGGGGGMKSHHCVAALFTACLQCLNKETVLRTEDSKLFSGISCPIATMLPVGIIADIGIQSLNYYSGIALLEQIITHRSLDKSSKTGNSRKSSQVLTGDSLLMDSDCDGGRTKVFGSVQNPVAEVWSQLSKLYDALGDRDVLLGTVHKMVQPLEESASMDPSVDGDNKILENVTAAIDFEASGKFEEAADLYSSLMQSADATKSTAEAIEYASASSVYNEIWENRSFDCMQRLLKWSTIQDKIEDLVDEYEGKDHSGMEVEGEPLISRPLISRIFDISDKHRKEKLLSLYVKSLTHTSVGAVDSDPESVKKSCHELNDFFRVAVYSDVEGTSFDGGMKSWVENKLSKELAVGFAIRQEWMKSKSCAHNCMDKFLSTWSALDICALPVKRQMLAGLQHIVEIEDVANANIYGRLALGLKKKAVANNAHGIDSVFLGSTDLNNAWNTSYPSNLDSLSNWNDIASTRHILFNAEKILLDSGAFTAASSDRVKKAGLSLAKYHVRTAVAAVHQGILPAVGEHLKKSNGIRRSILSGSPGLTTLSLDEVIAVYKYNAMTIDRENQNIMSDSAKIHGYYEKTMALLDRKLMQMEQGSDADDASFIVSVMKACWVAEWSRNVNIAQDIRENCTVSAVSLYQKAIADVVEKSIAAPECRSAPEVIGSAYGQLAKHCHYILKGDALTTALGRDDSSRPRGYEPNDVQYAKIAISSFTDGIALGDSYCKEHILQFLNIVGEYGLEVAELLDARIVEMAPATFLKYAAQLMGCLDKPEGSTAVKILEHVAKHYPGALYYPFKITSEYLGAQGRALSATLRLLLHNSTLDVFVNELHKLTHPELRWNDGLKELSSMVKNAAKNKITNTKEFLGTVKSHYRELRIDVFQESESSIKKRNSIDYNCNWASKDFLANIAKIAGANGEKLVNINAVSQLQEMSTTYTRKHLQHGSGEVALGHFSPWLANSFDPVVHRIEVPGQYSSGSPIGHRFDSATSLSLASHESVECIMGFDPLLLVMSSIRRPKRIKIYTNHGLERMFLVKGGEDLRNDERIEQLFVLMNSIVLNSSRNASVSAPGNKAEVASLLSVGEGADYSLRARTYTVVPMTSKVGLLEWVANTVPLKKVIRSEMKKDKKFIAENPGCLDEDMEVDLCNISACITWRKWLKNNDYNIMFKQASREHAAKVFDKMESKVPNYFVKNRLLAMAASVETYITLRSEFAKTLAVSSIFCYVLGIGDRHLDNLLLDTACGSIVQIDFGICFGMGTSVLPVPELIPFRLTTQLRSVLLPLDGTGLLRQYMSTVMQTLRADDGFGMLANALEIYINDPVLDWLRHCVTTPGSPSPGEGPSSSSTHSGNSAVHGSLDKDMFLQKSTEGTWEPRRRITNTLRKLIGVHPVILSVEELQSNSNVIREKTLEDLSRIVTGTRAKELENQNDRRLAVGEQISVLIDLATDPNILARQFMGLMSWL